MSAARALVALQRCTARWWRVAALLAAVAGLVFLVDHETIASGLRALRREPAPLLLALLAYTAGFMLRARAWQALLPDTTPWPLALRGIFAALAVNHALPGPVGEVVRARTVTTADFPFRRALASVVGARVLDVTALGLLAVAAGVLAGDAPGWLRVVGPAAAALAFGVAAFLRWRKAEVPSGALARGLLWAVPSWAVEAGMVYAVARAAGYPLSLPGAMLATTAGLLAQVVAFLPGGIGTYEAGVASGLVALGVPAASALSIAVVTHGVKFVYSFAVGLPALGGNGMRELRGRSRTVAPALPGEAGA